MKYKCYTPEARKFESKLNTHNMTYDQFRELCKFYENMTLSAKAEVKDLLSEYKE